MIAPSVKRDIRHIQMLILRGDEHASRRDTYQKVHLVRASCLWNLGSVDCLLGTETFVI